MAIAMHIDDASERSLTLSARHGLPNSPFGFRLQTSGRYSYSAYNHP